MHSIETSLEVKDINGNIRSEEQLYMNGLEVFNFAIQNVPVLVNEILEYTNKKIDDIDLFAFHQANGIINKGLIEKLSIPVEKAPMDVVKEYGNASCVTIPSVLCRALGVEEEPKDKSVVLIGFGVGLSLAACYTNLKDCIILPIIEYENKY